MYSPYTYFLKRLGSFSRRCNSITIVFIFIILSKDNLTFFYLTYNLILKDLYSFSLSINIECQNFIKLCILYFFIFKSQTFFVFSFCFSLIKLYYCNKAKSIVTIFYNKSNLFLKILYSFICSL